MNIILGSQSPRRCELMKGMDIPFSLVNIHADETFPPTLQAGDIPLYIAHKKADAYISQLQDNDLLITSDTIVWLNNRMLGKPQDINEAKQMLAQLSNNTHQVYTAVCFTSRHNNNIEQHTLVDKTNVTFRKLTTEEINYYVEHYKPLDKAGAYGIQEWIGYIGVTCIEGSYFNVMGFPIQQVYTYLLSHHYIHSQK